MEKDRTYFEGLIARYFSGEASPEEVAELSAWVALSAGNESIFKASQHAWTALETYRIEESVDVEEEFQKMYDVRCTMYDLKTTNHESRITNHESRLTNHDSRLTTHDSRILHPASFILRAAAVIILLAIPSFFLYRYFTKPVMEELAATTGRVESTLPDGSKISLNTGAVLRYPGQFRGKKRSVSLEGEAYFDVAHDASKPFIIATDGVRVEVKGTSFYINTRLMNGDFELVLTTGKVELYFERQPGKSMTVSPGEKAIIHGGQISISPNEDANYMAWKTHRIIFTNDPLDAVAAALSKVYQADIRLGDPSLASCRLTATFDNQSLESVLKIIKATLDVDVRNSGTLVEISGKGCR